MSFLIIHRWIILKYIYKIFTEYTVYVMQSTYLLAPLRYEWDWQSCCKSLGSCIFLVYFLLKTHRKNNELLQKTWCTRLFDIVIVVVLSTRISLPWDIKRWTNLIFFGWRHLDYINSSIKGHIHNLLVFGLM